MVSLRSSSCFAVNSGINPGHSRNVSTRPRQAGNESRPNGITTEGHDDRDHLSCVLRSLDCFIPCGHDDVDLDMDQLGRERGEAIEFSLCISILNDNVFPLDVPKLAQTLRGMPRCALGLAEGEPAVR